MEKRQNILVSNQYLLSDRTFLQSFIFLHQVLFKRNVALVRVHLLVIGQLLIKGAWYQLLLRVCFYPARNRVNTREWNWCHTSLIGDYPITSKSTRLNKCDIVLEWYCTVQTFTLVLPLHSSDLITWCLRTYTYIVEFPSHEDNMMSRECW